MVRGRCACGIAVRVIVAVALSSARGVGDCRQEAVDGVSLGASEPGQDADDLIYQRPEGCLAKLLGTVCHLQVYAPAVGLLARALDMSVPFQAVKQRGYRRGGELETSGQPGGRRMYASALSVEQFDDRAQVGGVQAAPRGKLGAGQVELHRHPAQQDHDGVVGIGGSCYRAFSRFGSFSGRHGYLSMV